MKIKTRTLSDGTKQVGYHNGQGWVGITNLSRNKGGWISDAYGGWYKTIGEWKLRFASYQET